VDSGEEYSPILQICSQISLPGKPNKSKRKVAGVLELNDLSLKLGRD
jgi:hypothetical protein